MESAKRTRRGTALTSTVMMELSFAGDILAEEQYRILIRLVLLRRWREGTCPYVVECHHRHYYLEEELDTLEITLCRFVTTFVYSFP